MFGMHLAASYAVLLTALRDTGNYAFSVSLTIQTESCASLENKSFMRHSEFFFETLSHRRNIFECDLFACLFDLDSLFNLDSLINLDSCLILTPV